MRVLLFGEIADVVGSASIEIKRPADTNELRQSLINEYPALANFRFQLAINREQVTPIMTLKDNDEIALMPPFAGG